jgi:hypothetical protein
MEPMQAAEVNHRHGGSAVLILSLLLLILRQQISNVLKVKGGGEALCLFFVERAKVQG